MKIIKKSLALFMVVSMMAVIIFNKENVSSTKVYGANTPTNGTMFQYFEWEMKVSGNLWTKVAEDAAHLSNVGFTSVWLPPAYKGASGGYSSGYDPYDLYDLGEFDQKGTKETKYGSNVEYLNAINKLHANGILVYADIVLNHKMGADSTESVKAYIDAGDNRNYQISGPHTINAWTKFTFPGRGNKYSSFKWNASYFDGVDDYGKIYRFNGKNWDWTVDNENGNYDYLMGADLDMGNQALVTELKNWGVWYTNTAKLDGFRLDAVKHIKFEFFSEWLSAVRSRTGKELFTVGEYYSFDVGKLNDYINKTGGVMSLFDFPLRNNFNSASHSGYGGGGFDMSKLFANTLVASNPTHAVTYVENHDLQPGREGEGMLQWFKPMAYTAILTREGGYPCVFYGDYYGSSFSSQYPISPMKNIIDKLMKARTECAYGTQHDYLDDHNVVGWTREGISQRPNSGLAALITDGDGGSKRMYVGTKNAGEEWYDITGNIAQTVKIGSDGYATFKVNGGSCSVWVNKAVKVTASNNNTTQTTTASNVSGNTTSNNNGQGTSSNQNTTYNNSESNNDAITKTTALGDEETTTKKDSDEKDPNQDTEETTTAGNDSEGIVTMDWQNDETTDADGENKSGNGNGGVVGIVIGISVGLSATAGGVGYFLTKRKKK